jgi:hypothetical protein
MLYPMATQTSLFRVAQSVSGSKDANSQNELYFRRYDLGHTICSVSCLSLKTRLELKYISELIVCRFVPYAGAWDHWDRQEVSRRQLGERRKVGWRRVQGENFSSTRRTTTRRRRIIVIIPFRKARFSNAEMFELFECLNFQTVLNRQSQPSFRP